MSSITSEFSNNNCLPYPSAAIALTYDIEEGIHKVVPFTYNKLTGVFDFDFSGSFSPSTSVIHDNTVYLNGSSFGGIYLVNDIGPNIVAWCENTANADVGTVRILEKPIVIHTNQIAVEPDANNDQAMVESDTPFDLENGTSANNSNTTYLFKKPLIVTYTVGGARKYRMFNTHYNPNA